MKFLLRDTIQYNDAPTQYKQIICSCYWTNYAHRNNTGNNLEWKWKYCYIAHVCSGATISIIQSSQYNQPLMLENYKLAFIVNLNPWMEDYMIQTLLFSNWIWSSGTRRDSRCTACVYNIEEIFSLITNTIELDQKSMLTWLSWIFC